MVVIDPETVGARPIEIREDLPGGAWRLYGEADGIDHVVVNGTEICRKGEFTGATPGGIMRSGRDCVGTAHRLTRPLRNRRNPRGRRSASGGPRRVRPARSRRPVRSAPMLSHLRVLDLTDGGATIAGRLLADLGAEVILLEPPGGIGLRGEEPFAADRPGPESSLSFWATNHSKQSVVVDLTTAAGRDTLRRLAADADVLFESQPVGSLAAAGVGPSDLMAANPSLVVVSITPFGLDGPKAGWAAHDLTVQASSGVMHLTGDADRAPLQQSALPQAFLHAGLDAVVAALVALAGREVDGWGRHVDVSAQTSTMLCAQQCVLAEAWGDVSPSRGGGAIALGGVRYRVIYPASDGWVSISLFFGPTFGDYSRRLIELLCAEGLVDPAVLDRDYTTFGVELRDGRRPAGDLDELNAAIEAWTRRRTRAELFDLATKHRLLLVPVSTIADVRSSPQLAARDFFRTIEEPSPGGEPGSLAAAGGIAGRRGRDGRARAVRPLRRHTPAPRRARSRRSASTTRPHAGRRHCRHGLPPLGPGRWRG